MKPFILALLFILSAAQPCLAATECDYSGEDWEASSTRLMVSIRLDGTPTSLHFNSLYFMFRYFNEAQHDGRTLGRIENFSMLDYSSIGSSTESYLKGTADTRPKGWFLWTNHQLAGSSFPYIAAFSDQADARAAMHEWGGEILDAEEMVVDLYGFFASRHGLLEGDLPAARDSHAATDSGAH